MIDKVRSMIEKLGQGPSKATTSSNHFSLACKVVGQLPFTCTTVTVTAARKEGGQPLPQPVFKWYRVVEKRNYLIEHGEAYYHVTADDVGSTIICIVTSGGGADSDFVSFGPVEVSPNVRSDVEAAVVKEETVFLAKVGGQRTFDAWLGPEKLTFSDPETKESFRLSGFVYKVDPKSGVELSLIGLSKHAFFERFGREVDETWTLSLRFENFEARDRFMVLWKLFTQVKLLPFQKELLTLEAVAKKQGLFSGAGGTSAGDLLVVAANLRATITKSVNFAKSLLEERGNAQRYIESLETDLINYTAEFREHFGRGDARPTELRDTLQKLEKSMQVIKENKMERSRREEDKPVASEQVASLKEALALERKQNFLLSKELKATKERHREKRDLINKSLAEAGLGGRQSELSREFAHSELPLRVPTDSFAKKPARPVTDASAHAEEDFYRQQFDILREKLRALATNSVTDKKLAEGAEADFKRSERQAVDLLNAENEMLKKRIDYLMKEKAGSSAAKSQPTSQQNLDELQARLAQLKSENSLLLKEKAKSKAELPDEEVLRKQQTAARVEIDKLKAQVTALVEQETALRQQLEEKDAAIRGLSDANTRLIDSLKKMEEVMQVNDSLISNS